MKMARDEKFETAVISLFNVAYTRVIPSDWTAEFAAKGKTPAEIKFLDGDSISFKCNTTGKSVQGAIPDNADFTQRLLLINDIATKLAALAKE
jgi:hypothetical protein